MQTLPGKVSVTGCSVPSSMPLVRARSVSGLVSVASTVRSAVTHVSVGLHGVHTGGRQSVFVMQNTLAVALQWGWNGTLTGSPACPRTTTHGPLAGAQSSCDMQSWFGARSQCGLTWQTPPPRQSKQLPFGQSARVGHGSPAWMPPMHVEPVEHELPVQSSFMMHMRPVIPGVGLKRQNPKPGSKLAVGTIGDRLEISSVMVLRRMRSTGSTLVTVIVQAIGSPTLAMGMGTQGVHDPPGHWSADVHRSPPLGPPTQMVAVQMPFGTPAGLSQSRVGLEFSGPSRKRCDGALRQSRARGASRARRRARDIAPAVPRPRDQPAHVARLTRSRHVPAHLIAVDPVVRRRYELTCPGVRRH